MDLKNRRLLSVQPCARTFREKSSTLMRPISHPRLKWVKKTVTVIVSQPDISNKLLTAKYSHAMSMAVHVQTNSHM